MTSYSLALVLHVGAGSVALLSFWAAGLIRKGTPRHRLLGRIYLWAIVAVIASGVPLVLAMTARGQQVGALFLSYLLLLLGNSCWSSWRAIRDRQHRQRYYGPLYWIFAASTGGSGLAMVALGVEVGALLLQVFGGVGLLGAAGALLSWRRAPHDPKWWLKEHYGNMIGNGVATHIAFFGIGLRNALPGVDPQLLQLFAWFAPLAGALIAAWWLHRRYGGRPPQQPVSRGALAAG